MKNFCDSLKIFVIGLIFSSVMIFSANCSADYYNQPVTEMKNFFGNWYDKNGNLALKIGSDYSINGCKVVSFYMYTYDDRHRPNNFVIMPQSSADYVAKIIENGRTRDIELDVYGQDYFKILVANGNIYYNTINPKHFESVGGIYLGMNKNKILSLYGQPSTVQAKRNVFNGNEIWKYNNEGFELKFVEDFVTEIKIYSTGNRRFDWSGLSCKNSLQDFISKYRYNSQFWNNSTWTSNPERLKRIEGGDGIPIGYGEGIYLSDYPNSIILKLNYMMSY